MQIIQIIPVAILLILLFAVVLILLALFFPFKFRMKASKYENTFIKLTVSWFFRAVYLTYTLKNDFSASKLYILGFPVNLDKTNDLNKKEKKSFGLKNIKDKFNARKTTSSVKIQFSYIKSVKKQIIKQFKRLRKIIKQLSNYRYKKEAVNYTLKLLKTVVQAVKFKKFNIYINFGFENPYDTGITTAVLSVVNSFFPVKIKYAVDFEKKVFKGNANISAVSTVWKIGFPILMYILKIKNLEDKK